MLSRKNTKSFLQFWFYFIKPYLWIILINLVLLFSCNYIWWSIMNDILTDILTTLNNKSLLLVYKRIFQYIAGWIISSIIHVTFRYIQTTYIYSTMEQEVNLKCYEIVSSIPVQISNKIQHGYLENIVFRTSSNIKMMSKNIFNGILGCLKIVLILIYKIWKYSWKLGLCLLIGNIIYFILLTLLTYYYINKKNAEYIAVNSAKSSLFVNIISNKILNYVYDLKSLFTAQVKTACINEEKAMIELDQSYLSTLIMRENVYLIFHIVIFMLYAVYSIQCGYFSFSTAAILLLANKNIIVFQWGMYEVFASLLEQYTSGCATTKMYDNWLQDIEKMNEQNLNGKKIIEGINKIEMRNVSFKYNEIIILNNISFVINKGDIVMFSGPSGCGKTTLMNIISGIITDYEGEVLINDVNIREYAPRSLLNNISYIMQGTNILAGTIEYNIKLNDENIRTEDIEKLATIFNLKDITRDTGVAGNTLSGGERQRVCVIRGLVRCTSRKLIISDELTSNLDYNNATLVLRHIIDIARNNNSILILIEHLPFASELVSRMFLFELDNNSNIYVLKTDNLII